MDGIPWKIFGPSCRGGGEEEVTYLFYKSDSMSLAAVYTENTGMEGKLVAVLVTGTKEPESPAWF